MSEKLAIFWFRRDLRVEDNAGLFYALNSGYKVLPLFIFDIHILDQLDNKHDARVSFIHEQIRLLDQIFKLQGSNFVVKIGEPLAVFKNLIEDFQIAQIYTNRDYEPYALKRDKKVEKLCLEKSIEFLSFKDHVIFEKDEILNDSGLPYKVFTPYKNRWLKKLARTNLLPLESEKYLKNLSNRSVINIPSLGEIGFQKSEIEIPKKEISISILSDYAASRDYPSKNGTSRLGVHLRFGTISIREAVQFGQTYSDTWLNELIWREFYSMILAHFPEVTNNAFKPAYDFIAWRNDENEFEKWCNGSTGYPIVDAGMRELVSTGYMHNRVRMIAASFLTKHLLIDWRWGEAFFAKHLLDFDLASNNGGWQWAAGTGTDAQPYFRVFNPTSQTDKFDKEFEYIKKWIPEYGTKSYPQPMVDHQMARKRAIETYKAALN
jgi:deoxyribodipyrimidine photo-lyase